MRVCLVGVCSCILNSIIINWQQEELKKISFPQLVSTIHWNDHSFGEILFVSYQYDNNRQLISYHSEAYGSRPINFHYIYSADRNTVTVSSDTAYYENKTRSTSELTQYFINNRLTTMNTRVWNNQPEENKIEDIRTHEIFNYDAQGRLIEVIGTDNYFYKFTWKDSLLTKIKQRRNDECLIFTIDYEHGANNTHTSIDLFRVIANTYGMLPGWLLGGFTETGIRIPLLPTTITASAFGETYTSTLDYTYSKNK